MAATDSRSRRIAYYAEEVEKIKRVLTELIRLSNAKSAMLIDREGHMITKTGQATTFDDETISALVAGSFAATREMAKLLGEEEFSVLFHQGRRENIQLSLVRDRALLGIVFDDKTTIGMVRLYASEAATRITKIIEEVERKSKASTGVPTDLGASAEKRLDEFFREGAK